MKTTSWYIIGLSFIIGIGVVWWYTLKPDSEILTSLSAVEAMSGGDQEGYLRVTGPREFAFPDDHGSHPGYKTEWWYYTGNLFTQNGRQFGYQFTIFRNQLHPPVNGEDTSTMRSDWSTDQFYLGHFAISDMKNEKHLYEERSSRGAAGLAGIQIAPYRIWLEDWEVRGVNSKNSTGKSFPVHINAEMEDGTAIDLQITPAKPLVLQGEQGYDRKGSAAGNASYYLSFTRMDTKGILKINDTPFEVSGSTWMDHEWSTSALDGDQKGWDWFSIQLSNGYDLMYYQLRLQDGSASKFKTASLISPEGDKKTISPGGVFIKILNNWRSPHSKSIYPSKWKMDIPEVGLSLDVQTVFPDQEMDVSVKYYEGAISVSGNMDGDEISGNGFIEMTGYRWYTSKNCNISSIQRLWICNIHGFTTHAAYLTQYISMALISNRDG